MNQEKIGKFIAECRKQKKMTQYELGEKLGVTEKSISNWENGRNMPDLSLFKQLCEELNITINELLSGERISEENYQEKFEENIINTISYSNKKLEKKNQLIGLILMMFGILMNMLGLMAFNPDSHSCFFSVIIGVILSVLGFFKLINSKSNLKTLICLLVFFIGYMSTVIFFDYIGVAYNNRPPIFSTHIVTIDSTIYYDTLFYDVIRCNKNSEEETYEIIKNRKYDDEIIMTYCK